MISGERFTLPWRGEGRRSCNERRGGVTVSPRPTVPEWRDHPTPSRISLRSIRADPPPPGEGKRSVAALQPADMLLRVELEPDALDQVQLGFEEVDVMFLVLHQLFEQVA